MLDTYIYGSHAIVLAYDVTSFASYKNLQDWYHYVVKTVGNSKPPLVALMANKSLFTLVTTHCIVDLQHIRTVKKELHDRWATDNRFESFFVSAKNGDQVHAAFFSIAASLAKVKLDEATQASNQSVVTAHIVNYATVDAQLTKEEQPQGPTAVREVVASHGAKSNICIVC